MTARQVQATVQLQPEEDLGLVVLKPRWLVDNFHETAVFATEDEARRFAHVRWGLIGPEIATLPPRTAASTRKDPL